MRTLLIVAMLAFSACGPSQASLDSLSYWKGEQARCEQAADPGYICMEALGAVPRVEATMTKEQYMGCEKPDDCPASYRAIVASGVPDYVGTMTKAEWLAANDRAMAQCKKAHESQCSSDETLRISRELYTAQSEVDRYNRPSAWGNPNLGLAGEIANGITLSGLH